MYSNVCNDVTDFEVCGLIKSTDEICAASLPGII